MVTFPRPTLPTYLIFHETFALISSSFSSAHDGYSSVKMLPVPQPRMHISGVTFVRPAEPVKPIQFSCSAVENLCARVHHSFAQFFPIRSSADVEQIFLDLKQGLSLVMNELPIITGVLRQNERGDFSVEIPQAPHAGTAFHFSDTSSDPRFPSFRELQECGFPYVDGDLDGLEEFRPDPFPTSEDGQPVFVGKICHVRGGIVWTASLSHLVTDLAQGTAILISWAKYTKQVADAGGKLVPIPRQFPWPDRKRLLPEVEGPLTLEEIAAVNKTLDRFSLLDPTDPEKLVEDIGNLFLKADVSEASPDQGDCPSILSFVQI